MEPFGLRVGVVQMRSDADPWGNLARCLAFIEEARNAGCRLICFPENVLYRGPRQPPGDISRSDLFFSRDEQGEMREESEFSSAFREALREIDLWVSWGSVLESSAHVERPYNAHWVTGPGGGITSYRKIHLFQYEGQRARYDEGRDCSAGCQLVTVDVGSFKFGLSICYDLRFPELYRDMVLREDAQVLLVPAAFTKSTGRDHWQALLKTRAVENQCYVLASAQWGTHRNQEGQQLECFGHSLALDPWGEPMAEAPAEGDALLVVDLSSHRIQEVRTRLPALENAAYYFQTRSGVRG